MAANEDSLYHLLQKAKPLWHQKDLYRVCTKLAKVDITDAESLGKAINEHRLNSRLADAGERKLKAITLEQLASVVRRPYHARQLSEALDAGSLDWRNVAHLSGLVKLRATPLQTTAQAMLAGSGRQKPAWAGSHSSRAERLRRKAKESEVQPPKASVAPSPYMAPPPSTATAPGQAAATSVPTEHRVPESLAAKQAAAPAAPGALPASASAPSLTLASETGIDGLSEAELLQRQLRFEPQKARQQQELLLPESAAQQRAPGKVISEPTLMTRRSQVMDKDALPRWFADVQHRTNLAEGRIFHSTLDSKPVAEGQGKGFRYRQAPKQAPLSQNETQPLPRGPTMNNPAMVSRAGPAGGADLRGLSQERVRSMQSMLRRHAHLMSIYDN
mmetsp:Transcript_7795/g.17100  ORF Transcript_7795/g.17100 Transcript_7795/m.17100 type:complete len:388 (+) Transcript_7795:116-1279(+)